MKNLKNEITAALWLFGNWLKKKIIYLFKQVIAWFHLQWMELQDIGKEIKDDIDDLLYG